MAEKRHIRQQLRFTVTTYKFEIIATILITNISLIWKVQLMEIRCQGVRKWKMFGNHGSKESRNVLTVSSLTVICSLHLLDHRAVIVSRNWKACERKVNCKFWFRVFEFSWSRPPKIKKKIQQRHQISGQTIKPENWRMRNRTNQSNLTIQVSVLSGGDPEMPNLFHHVLRRLCIIGYFVSTHQDCTVISKCGEPNTQSIIATSQMKWYLSYTGGKTLKQWWQRALQFREGSELQICSIVTTVLYGSGRSTQSSGCFTPRRKPVQFDKHCQIFLSSSGSGTGSTQPREPPEVNWGATWIKK